MAHDSLRNDKKGWGENPFAAPGTEVEEARGTEGSALLDVPNSLSAGRGIEWIREGWGLMQGSMGTWIGIGVIWFVITFVLQFVPILGPLALTLLMPVLIAGTMLACREKARGGDIGVGHLFAGFSNRLGTLMMLGVIYFLIVMFVSVIIVVCVGLTVGFSYFSYYSSGTFKFTPILLLPILLACLFIIPLVLVQWLTPQLVVLHEELTAWEAYKLATRGVLRNILPFTVNGIIFFGIIILALIPLGLGLLITIPLTFCIFYAAYRDIFVAR
jgi:uncharacterized membrane protein